MTGRSDGEDRYKQGRESRDEFRTRLARLLPNFPPEVLEQWPFEHGGVLANFPWFDPASAIFTECLWSTDRIISEIKHWHELGVEMEVAKALGGEYSPRYWLLPHMRENGTWPVGPIVYDNAYRLPIQRGGGAPRYVMLEGMHRLGFLRALVKGALGTLKSQHSLWLVRHS